MLRKIIRYLLSLILAGACLWVARNALVETPVTLPGETLAQAVRALFLGKPMSGDSLCPLSVHDLYTATGPDGKMYPTWHPPVDSQHHCYFDHEHGSDPQSYIGFAESGTPLFGYTAAKAGIEEPHQGYKVFVANNDLRDHAWMILLNQDTSSPQRVLAQFHTVDWNISDLTRKGLVDLHLMADFGPPVENCPRLIPIPIPTASSRISLGQHRALVTTNCVRHNQYEYWMGAVSIPDIFEAAPLFGVDNPITAVNVQNFSEVELTCSFRLQEGGCSRSDPWKGNRREILHPGQLVQNHGAQQFYTDAYGNPASQASPDTLEQYVTSSGWDTRQCCGPQVVFRIQTYSNGIFLADPSEEPGSAEFGYGVP